MRQEVDMVVFGNNKFLSRIPMIYRGILKSGGGVGAVAAYVMVFMVVFAIIGRIFDYSVTYAVQITMYCSAFICFIGASYTQSLRRNITITLVTGRLPKKVQRWLLAITTTISFVFSMILLYYSSLMFQNSIITGARSTDPLRVPMAGINWIPTIGFALLALVLLTQAVQTFWEIFSGKPIAEEAKEPSSEKL
jgi:TRAP-type C4-dicarboxylate transport system permease small subunit